MSSAIVIAALVVVLVAVYFFRRSRRCPHRNPLCRASRPCLLCYRDLYRTHVVKGERTDGA